MNKQSHINILKDDAAHRLTAAEYEVNKIKDELEALENFRRPHMLDNALLGPRGLTDKWEIVIEYMSLRLPLSVTYDEIMSFSERHNLFINQSALRAQMHRFVKLGVVEPVSTTAYLLVE